MISTEFLPGDLEQLPYLQPADWGDLMPRFRYFIDSPFCKPIKIEEQGQVIAIGASMFHKDTVWLACIVVHPDHRKKGLGATITQDLISDVDSNVYPTIYLDATDFGYPVYKKLGFEVETEYAHYIRNKKRKIWYFQEIWCSTKKNSGSRYWNSTATFRVKTEAGY